MLPQANRGGCPKRHREGAPERGECQAKRRSSWHFRVQEVGETQCDLDMYSGVQQKKVLTMIYNDYQMIIVHQIFLLHFDLDSDVDVFFLRLCNCASSGRCLALMSQCFNLIFLRNWLTKHVDRYSQT